MNKNTDIDNYYQTEPDNYSTYDLTDYYNHIEPK